MTIQVVNFHKSYGRLGDDASNSVSGISFTVERGQVLALVGSNGAGKSTTLRTLACISPPTQGELLVGGFDVTRQPLEAKRITAYVPDQPEVFLELTIQQHLSFIAGVYQIADAPSKIDRLLAHYQLTAKRHEAARTLSRGMLQKLMLCGAHLQSPQVLLLDEPLTGLDPLGISMAKGMIQELAQGGAAVVISSHMLAIVEQICTHVVLLDDGKQLFYGPIDQLRLQHGCSENGSLEKIFLNSPPIDLENAG